MATKNYMINDKWLDLDKQNIVELQSVDGELDSLKVNGSEIVTPSGKITITENGTDIDVAQYALADVNVEGGGGSSDFSTANALFHVEFIGYTGISLQPSLVTVAYVENNTLKSGNDIDNPLTTANNPEIVTYKGVGFATLWIMQEDAVVAYEITQGNADVTINEYGGYDIEFTDDFEMNLTITKNT